METLNVNKSVNQSENGVHAGCRHRNRAVSIQF